MLPGKVFTRVVIIAVFTLAVLYPGYRKLRVFNEQVRVLEQEIEITELKNRQLREQIKALKEDAFFIEKRAREMGMIKEGEKIYRIRFREEEADENR